MPCKCLNCTVPVTIANFVRRSRRTLCGGPDPRQEQTLSPPLGRVQCQAGSNTAYKTLARGLELAERRAPIYIERGRCKMALSKEAPPAPGEGPPDANRLVGTVEEIAYLGDASIYLVRLEAGQTVRVTVPNRHRKAELPKFSGKTFTDRAKSAPAEPNREAPAFGRKAVIYATCFVDYNKPATGEAARAVLAHNGVETETVYPACCGMPYLEHGNIPQVAEQAKKVSTELVDWIDRGYNIIALTASCGLMLKFEWPLILPDNENIRKLSAATADISEYMVGISKQQGLAPGLSGIDGGVTVHMACHARAQNIGAKSAEMLRLIPDAKVDVVERCSGHGGTFGVMKETRPHAEKVARPAVRQIKQKGNDHLCSDCPLACKHLIQVMEDGGEETIPSSDHPIEIFARAYGLVQE